MVGQQKIPSLSSCKLSRHWLPVHSLTPCSLSMSRACFTPCSPASCILRASFTASCSYMRTQEACLSPSCPPSCSTSSCSLRASFTASPLSIHCCTQQLSSSLLLPRGSSWSRGTREPSPAKWDYSRGTFFLRYTFQKDSKRGNLFLDECDKCSGRH